MEAGATDDTGPSTVRRETSPHRADVTCIAVPPDVAKGLSCRPTPPQYPDEGLRRRPRTHSCCPPRLQFWPSSAPAAMTPASMLSSMWRAVATSASPPQLYESCRGRLRIAVAVSNIPVQQRICRAATAAVVSMDRNPPLSIPKDPPLVAVTVDSGEWRVRAACRGADLSVFFSPDGERRGARDRRGARARQICQVCPVLVRCRDHALTVGESYGVWGGMTESDRRKHTHRARRGERRPLGSFHERPVGAASGVRRAAFTGSFDRAYTGGASRGRPTTG